MQHNEQTTPDDDVTGVSAGVLCGYIGEKTSDLGCA